MIFITWCHGIVAGSFCNYIERWHTVSTMSARVRIQKHRLPEIPGWNNTAVFLALAELLQHEFPAFIMRAPRAALADSSRRHDWHVLNVGQALTRLLPNTPNTIRELRRDYPANQFRRGDLVSDATKLDYVDSSSATTRPEVHTTVSGGGDVYVAHIGINPQRAHMAAMRKITDEQHPTHAFNAYLEVDPELVSPHVYVGSVAVGDSVVSSGSFGKYAVWQRFDTDPDLGERSYSFDQFVPVSPKQLGFDL